MSSTLDRVKYGAGLASAAAFSFLKINLVGGLSTALAVTSILLTVVGQSFDGGGPGHAGGQAIVAVLFTLRPVAMVLTTIILFTSPFVLFALGNKYILMKLAARIGKDNGETYLYPLLDKALNKVRTEQPELLRKGGDSLKVRLRLIQGIKDRSENKWAKRITLWGLRKADLSNVDLGAEDLSLTQVLRDRIVLALLTITTPSRKFFWIIVGLQWLVVLLTLVKVI